MFDLLSKEDLSQPYVFKPVDMNTLGNDPVYREIFFGMVHDVLMEMRAALECCDDLEVTQIKFTSELSRLLHAARRTGLPDWMEVLQQCEWVGPPSLVQMETQLARFQELADLENSKQISAEFTRAFELSVFVLMDELKPMLGKLSQYGNNLYETGADSTLDDIIYLAGRICQIAEKHGFLQVVATLERVVAYADSGLHPFVNHFSRLEFLLYEELAAITSELQNGSQGLAFNPQAILRSWSVDHLYSALLEMQIALQRITEKEMLSKQCEFVVDSLRQIYYACQFYKLETTAHLSMSLRDHFARATFSDDVVVGNWVLMNIATSYLTNIKQIFDEVDNGETPDMEPIEKLLREVYDCIFTVRGLPTSAQVEGCLGLQQSFHKVLAPNNVETVMIGLEKKHHFYMVRANINDDDELTQRFKNWADSGAAQIITNLTALVEGHTEFDFLISSSLDETSLNEALDELDPSGKRLHLDRKLTVREMV